MKRAQYLRFVKKRRCYHLCKMFHKGTSQLPVRERKSATMAVCLHVAMGRTQREKQEKKGKKTLAAV